MVDMDRIEIDNILEIYRIKVGEPPATPFHTWAGKCRVAEMLVEVIRGLRPPLTDEEIEAVKKL